jgi:hypothetical protein
MIVKVVGASSSDKVRELITREFGLHFDLSSKGCRHIIDCFGLSERHRASQPQLGYGYIEYASYGDLRGLMMRNEPV